MGRKFMAVVTALITSLAIIWVTYMIGTAMAPFYPKNLEYMSGNEVASYVQSVPAGTFIVDLIGYALAAFTGGFIATKMGRRWSSGPTLALVTGGILTVGELAMAAAGAMDVRFFWPQPMWFVIVSVLMFIPLAFVGYIFAHRVGHTAIMTA